MPDLQNFVVNSRRSQRVAARVRIRVTRRAGENSALSEDAYTLMVNAHGGLIILAMIVEAREVLVLRNLMTSDEQLIRVVRVGEKQESKHQVAIEFTSPSPRFWHIDFPPADWKMIED